MTQHIPERGKIPRQQTVNGQEAGDGYRRGPGAQGETGRVSGNHPGDDKDHNGEPENDEHRDQKSFSDVFQHDQHPPGK